MQSSLVVWTPTKSSSAVDVVSNDLSATDEFVTRRLTEQGATEAPAGELEGLELAAMQACYVQLKQLVPTVPLNAELSRLQLLQHVIDYIGDLELALCSSSSASASSSPRQQQQQQQLTQPRTTHSDDDAAQRHCSVSVSLTDVGNTLLSHDSDSCRTTKPRTSPRSRSTSTNLMTDHNSTNNN